MFPQKDLLKSLPPVPQNLILTGNRVGVVVMLLVKRRQYWSRTGP